MDPAQHTRLMPLVAAGVLSWAATAGHGKPPGIVPIDLRQQMSMAATLDGEFRFEWTPRFLVAVEEGGEGVDELVSRLEQTCGTVLKFCRIMGLQTTPLERKLEVIVFGDRAGYERYTRAAGFDPAGTFGVYLPSLNRSVFYDRRNDPTFAEIEEQIEGLTSEVDRLRAMLEDQPEARGPVEVRLGDGERMEMHRDALEERLDEADRRLAAIKEHWQSHLAYLNRAVIRHEAAHQVLFNVGVHPRGAANPRWLVEGLACLLEVDGAEADGGLGAVNHERLADFRKAVAGEDADCVLTGDDLLTAMASGRVPPLRRLVSDRDVLAERGSQGSAAYAAAWSLAHFLYHVQRPALSAYITEVRARRAGQAVSPGNELVLFERYFGATDDDFVRRWGDHAFREAGPEQDAGR